MPGRNQPRKRVPFSYAAGFDYHRLGKCTAKPDTDRHGGLKRFIEDDDERGIRRDLVNRVRRVLTAMRSVETIEGLEGPPGWRIHQLTGDRAGTWSISVSGNWRITFELASDKITNLDLEDYH